MAHTPSNRADAVRNRKRILAAAREQIALHGPDVGMDEIAAAANVAVGTLYRHFPGKAELVAGILVEYVAQIAADAEAACARVEEGARAVEEITAFLDRALDATVNNQAAKAAAAALGADRHDPEAEDRAGTALAALIETAKADGDLEPDITVADFYLMFSALPADQTPEARHRWRTLILRAITTHNSTPEQARTPGQ
ncbi:helix-turn-helix domain-containing protein [Glycomyces mayteni]|uniref:Helix-turn-helix domain-containing protein n=1 Tax=Glycomyces mayteni TaxID=543887 RepID=A0ABW2D5D8_9ACTN